MKLKNKKGFTLIELLVVIAIIGILAIMSVPVLVKNIDKAKIVKLESEIQTIKSAVSQYYIDNGEFPHQIQLSDKNNLLKDYIDIEVKETPIGGQYILMPNKACKDDPEKNYVDMCGFGYKIKSDGSLEKNVIGDSYIKANYEVMLAIRPIWDKKEDPEITKLQIAQLAKDLGTDNIFIYPYKKEGSSKEYCEIFIGIIKK